MEKVLSKWYLDKSNYLNVLFKYPTLMRPTQDLFTYLFTYLLKL